MASSLEDLLNDVKEAIDDAKDLTDKLNGDPIPEPPQATVQSKLNSAKLDVDTILNTSQSPNIPGTPTPNVMGLPVPLTWTNGIAQLSAWVQDAVDAESNSEWQDCADACGSIQSGWQEVYDLT